MMAKLRGKEPSLRESLEDVIEEHGDDRGDLTSEERLMLLNIVSLRELDISDVMVPRADIVAIDIDTPFDEMVQVFKQTTHSRLPLFRDTLDDVIGMVHIKDVVGALAGEGADKAPPRIADIKRRVLFVPPSMEVIDLLLNMRINRIHMALVIDEYGGTDGLVTIEDLIEQIVGEIEDEHDEQAGPLIKQQRDGVLDVDARAAVADLEAMINVDVLSDDQDEEVDTVGGLVFTLAGRVPVRGEVIAHESGIEFEVIEADARRLKRLRVRLSKDT
ncbi:MAG: HlyC/CorC family transporter [Alphaproteobacteria bacterium]|nr:MAG: HlyC/CorC family transporter [Alphaproteobacteria bacterium]